MDPTKFSAETSLLIFHGFLSQTCFLYICLCLIYIIYIQIYTVLIRFGCFFYVVLNYFWYKRDVYGIPATSYTNISGSIWIHLTHCIPQARSVVRDLDPMNDLTFLRIRSKKHVSRQRSAHLNQLKYSMLKLFRDFLSIWKSFSNAGRATQGQASESIARKSIWNRQF